MYCTEADLLARFGEQELIELTDMDDRGIVDSAKITAAINDASAQIDAYLASRYQLPLSNVPTELKQHCCHIARFNLYRNGAPDDVKENRNNALGFIKDVAKGIASLGVSDSSAQASTTDAVFMESDGLTFGRKNSTGFI